MQALYVKPGDQQTSSTMAICSSQHHLCFFICHKRHHISIISLYIDNCKLTRLSSLKNLRSSTLSIINSQQFSLWPVPRHTTTISPLVPQQKAREFLPFTTWTWWWRWWRWWRWCCCCSTNCIYYFHKQVRKCTQSIVINIQ